MYTARDVVPTKRCGNAPKN